MTNASQAERKARPAVKYFREGSQRWCSFIFWLQEGVHCSFPAIKISATDMIMPSIMINLAGSGFSGC